MALNLLLHVLVLHHIILMLIMMALTYMVYSIYHIWLKAVGKVLKI